MLILNAVGLQIRPSGEDLIRNILQQGIDLKMSLMEYTFDKAIEKKQEEQRSNKEDDDE